MNNTVFFCFHRVSNEISPAYQPISVKTFEKIISFLNKRYFIVPLNDVSCTNHTKKSKAVITFDDAYYDFYEYALPILIKYNTPSVQHVITHCAETGESFWTQKLNKSIENYYQNKAEIIIPEIEFRASPTSFKEVQEIALNLYFSLLELPNRELIIKNLSANALSEVEYTIMMNWDEIRECSQNNVLFGSHTHTHKNLANLKIPELEFEIGHSVELLHKHLGYCISLAFPNGKYNKETLQVAEKYKCEFVFTTEKKHLLTHNEREVYPRFSLYHNEWWKNYVRLMQLKLGL